MAALSEVSCLEEQTTNNYNQAVQPQHCTQTTLIPRYAMIYPVRYT